MTNRKRRSHVSHNAMQWMVWFVLLGVLVACGGGNPGQNTDSQTNSQPSAPEAVGTSTATDPQQATLEPIPFITPRPVRDEEPLSPDQRNIPPVFPGINTYHAVEATIRTAPQPFQSAANPEEAAKAVVQICRCSNNNCDSAVGSGVIIHPSGIIATAYHVLLRNPANPNSGPFDDESDDTDNIVIALTTDVFAPAEPRFQARSMATKVDQDLALLQIVRDLQGNAIAPGDLALPALPVADVTNLFDREFRVLGYLTSGREPISIERVNFRRYEDNQRLVVVNRPLEPGNSGGPVLLEEAEGYEVAGIVIRRRATQGQLAQEGLVRTIDQLHTLLWTPGVPRAWGEEAMATVDESTQASQFQLGLSLNTVDLIDRRLRLLFYATDANFGQPWQPANTEGPLVLWADVAPQQMLMRQIVTLTVSTAALGIAPDRLRFYALLWNWDEQVTL